MPAKVKEAMKRALTWLSLLGVFGIVAALWLTRPAVVDSTRFASLQGNAAQGEVVFWAGGCASCHKAETSDDDLALPGGPALCDPVRHLCRTQHLF